MIIDPVSRVFGHMAHEKITAFLVGPGPVKAGSECMAAFVGRMIHSPSLHEVSPEQAVLTLGTLFPVVAEKITSRLIHAPFNQRPDLGMDGNHPIFTGFGFGSALHRQESNRVE